QASSPYEAKQHDDPGQKLSPRADRKGLASRSLRRRVVVGAEPIDLLVLFLERNLLQLRLNLLDGKVTGSSCQKREGLSHEEGDPGRCRSEAETHRELT